MSLLTIHTKTEDSFYGKGEEEGGWRGMPEW